MFNNSYTNLGSGMRRLVDLLVVLFLIGLTLSSFAFAMWYVVSAKDIREKVSDGRQFSVTGHGKVTAKPSIATFTAGVTTQGTKVSDAQGEANTRSAAIVLFLKGKGIDEKDITTISYYVSPQYEYTTPAPCLGGICPANVQRPPKISGYQVNTTLQVKVRDLTKADELISGVTTNGANEVGSLNFTLDDEELEKLRQQARQKAIADAQVKAAAVAKDLGVSIKGITSFSEGGAGYPYYAAKTAYGMGAADSAVPPPSPQVQPGEQEISSDVNISYQFR